MALTSLFNIRGYINDAELRTYDVDDGADNNNNHDNRYYGHN